MHLVKRLIVGRPLAEGRIEATLLPKRLALPIFSSDALSSVAYATEASLAVLLAASPAGRGLLVPVSLAVAALLVLVVLSYRQTVLAYPGGGGAYVVAGENLGRLSGLVAAASLLVDYVLTVAVSIAAGVLAITSAAPALGSARVELSLAFLVALTLANVRGVREVGRLFALPTYGFIVAIGVMIAVGLARLATGDPPRATVPDPVALGSAGTVPAIVALRAFASGCSALTGVEAIANGTRAFRPPQARNAAATLALLGVIAVLLFMGVSVLAYESGARPSGEVSVLAQVARSVFPAGSPEALGFLVVQAFTFAVLVLAANTAFQGFPRLAALLARDRFVPQAFANLGDRLVYSNGITLLAVASGLLLVAFKAEPDALLHLYLLGVFTAFTLSQAGMVRHWHRSSEPGRGRRMVMNGVGAAGTGLVTALVLATKFRAGAWMVLIAVPVIVIGLSQLRRHYDRTRRQLRTGSPDPAAIPTVTVVVALDGIDDATARAKAFVRGLRGPGVRVHPAPLPLGAGELPRGTPGLVNVVVPELFERRSLRSALRRTSQFALATRLRDQPGVVVTHVPTLAGSAALRHGAETTTEALVFVADVDDAASAAVAYARAIAGSRARAIHVALDPDAAALARREWEVSRMPLPLEIVDAPFRSLEQPVLETVRAVTARPDTIVAVVVPELATGRWWQELLHNERSLYLGWLLRFEPRVVLSRVPLRAHAMR